MLTATDLAARTSTAVDAAVRTAERHGFAPTTPQVLHDLFSVVVALDPEPVVARVPTVLPPGYDADGGRIQQRREVAVCRWLADTGHPVVQPALDDQPVSGDGYSMTFWFRVSTTAAPDQEPAAVGATIAGLHTALRPYPGELSWLRSLDESVPAMLDALRDDTTYVSPADRDRALREWEAFSAVLGDRASCATRFPGTLFQPVHGDAPAYNVLRTPDGPVDSDFELVSDGPVEWDLTFVGPDAVTAYEAGVGREVDAALLALCEAARMVQVVACFAMVPQQPVLGEGMRPLLESWRATTPCAGVLDA